MVGSPPSGLEGEWAEARTTVRNYDTLLQALRQYGFTFIAGLLTAQGLIEISLSSSSMVVPPVVKAGVLLASMTLIGSIFVLDKMYRRMEGTAVIRARLLERRLGYELTEDASEVYSAQQISTSVDVLYSLLFVVAAILGYFTLQSNLLTWPTWYASMTTVGATIGIILVWTVENRSDEWLIDWDADRYDTDGLFLRATLTNFSDLSVGAEADQPMFRLIDAKGHAVNAENSPKWVAEEQPIPPSGQRTWEMSLSGVPAGSYTLEVRRHFRFWKRRKLELVFRHSCKDRRIRKYTKEFEPVPKPVTVPDSK
jgi:hypothetical protein